MDEPKCHIVFSNSAAGTLRQALELAGQSDLILCPDDNFSFGPINSDEPDARIHWVEEVLGYTGWQEITDQTSSFLADFAAIDQPITAWLAQRVSGCFAGFLWWLSRIGTTPINVISAPLMPILQADRLVELLDGSTPLSAAERSHYQERWRQLRNENAALRVLEGMDLVSAPITYFDPILLSHVRPEWQKMALVVARTLVEFSDNGMHQTGDLLLASRLADLAEAGRLEWRGDLTHMQRCELRLRAEE